MSMGLIQRVSVYTSDEDGRDDVIGRDHCNKPGRRIKAKHE